MKPRSFIFQVEESDKIPAGKEGFREFLQISMEQWATVSGVLFREAYENEEAAINLTINFQAGIRGDSDNIDVYADTVGEEKKVITFDSEQEWTLGLADHTRNQGIDVYTLILHELGHVIGIHHSDMKNKSDVMHSDYVGRKTDLTVNDINRAQFLCGPSLSSYQHPLPSANKCHIMPIGDYVYLLNTSVADGKLIIHRSHDLRVWMFFTEIEGVPPDSTIIANRSGWSDFLVGFVPLAQGGSQPIQKLPAIRRNVQWQTPERLAKPKDAVHLKLPETDVPIRLAAVPVNYQSNTFWGFVYGDNSIQLVYHKTVDDMEKATANPFITPPDGLKIDHFELARVMDTALFAFWMNEKKAIFYTRDADFLQLSADKKYVTEVDGPTNPVGKFSVTAIGNTVFLAWLEQDNRLFIQAFEYDSNLDNRLRPSFRFDLSVPFEVDAETKTRIFYLAGKLYTAISTDKILHFVEH